MSFPISLFKKEVTELLVKGREKRKVFSSTQSRQTGRRTHQKVLKIKSLLSLEKKQNRQVVGRET